MGDLNHTAHTATAGDGGLREACQPFAAWIDALEPEFTDHDDDVIAGGLKSAFVTFGHLRRLRAALAQAPAVQAPAGEALREATEILISALDECGEIFGTIRDDYTDPRRECREGRELATEALKAARALLAATPTDAQPKAARPVGDEALREALAVIAFAQTIDDHYDMREFLKGWSEGDVSEWPEFLETLASHPTTGQETVATPRDGGVREALGQGTIADEPYDPLKCAIWAALLPFQDELRHSGGVTFMGLRNAVVEAVRSFAIASQVEALSAPGSAGPGEPEGGGNPILDGQASSRLEAACRAYHPNHWDTETPRSRSYYRMNMARALAATPSPAQEPGTGDTGERCGPRTITTSRQTCEGCSALILKDWSFMGENDDRDSGTGAKCGAADGKSISAYWSVLNNTPDWCPLRTTPATTAETPGPAEGAR